MIIAKIGDTILKLDDLKAAEILLAIAAKAERLESSYDENYKDYYHLAHLANSQARITIEITDAEPATPEQHRAHQAAREEKVRKNAEAAMAAPLVPATTN